MFLGEPPRSQADLQFRIAGFHVRITPWFWLAAVLLGIRAEDPRLVVMWVLAVLVSIVVHELGHAFAFRHFGSNAEIVLYHFGGLAIPTRGYGTPQRSKYGQIVIAAAGPALQMAAAAVVIAALMASGNGVPLPGFVGRWLGISGIYHTPNLMLGNFLQDFLYVSVYWALINLLPIYPLDGGQISRELFLLFNRTSAIKNSLMVSMFFAGAVAFYGLTSNQTYIGIMFGMLAYSNYTALQAYTGSSGGYGQRW